MIVFINNKKRTILVIVNTRIIKLFVNIQIVVEFINQKMLFKHILAINTNTLI